jgi:hypothetical protein
MNINLHIYCTENVWSSFGTFEAFMLYKEKSSMNRWITVVTHSVHLQRQSNRAPQLAFSNCWRCDDASYNRHKETSSNAAKNREKQNGLCGPTQLFNSLSYLATGFKSHFFPPLLLLPFLRSLIHSMDRFCLSTSEMKAGFLKNDKSGYVLSRSDGARRQSLRIFNETLN